MPCFKPRLIKSIALPVTSLICKFVIGAAPSHHNQNATYELKPFIRQALGFLWVIFLPREPSSSSCNFPLFSKHTIFAWFVPTISGNITGQQCILSDARKGLNTMHTYLNLFGKVMRPFCLGTHNRSGAAQCPLAGAKRNPPAVCMLPTAA
jgi:hypothetical protein